MIFSYSEMNNILGFGIYANCKPEEVLSLDPQYCFNIMTTPTSDPNEYRFQQYCKWILTQPITRNSVYFKEYVENKMRYHTRSKDSVLGSIDNEFNVVPNEAPQPPPYQVHTDYCYLIQLLVDRNNGRLKLGRTKSINKRFMTPEYRNCEILYTLPVTDCKKCESELINVFNSKFRKITESDNGSYGNEYYEGDRHEMENEFLRICNKYRQPWLHQYI